MFRKANSCVARWDDCEEKDIHECSTAMDMLMCWSVEYAEMRLIGDRIIKLCENDAVQSALGVTKVASIYQAFMFSEIASWDFSSEKSRTRWRPTAECARQLSRGTWHVTRGYTRAITTM